MNECQAHRRACTELRERLQDGSAHLQPQHQPFCVKAAESSTPPTGQGLPCPAPQGGRQAQRGGGWRKPSLRRQAKRAAPATARRRQGLKPARGETQQATHCSARNPAPQGKCPLTCLPKTRLSPEGSHPHLGQ
jgi:hypothetical protein